MTLEEIYSPVREDLGRVEERLFEAARCEESSLSDAIERILRAGGKRLRPALVLFAARGCNYTGERSIRMAVAMELVHTASLIHDDVIDEAEVRRGEPTVNSSWGNRRSVLLGDYLYTRVVDMVAEDGDLEVVRCLAQTAASMARGEMVQTLCRNELNVSEQEYLRIINRKTASLISCCCRVGALLGGNGNGEVEALAQYGRDLGMAFQITDDLLDFTADQQKLGKTLGNDIREGRLTLPFIRALAKADQQEREWLTGVFRAGTVDDQVLQRIRLLVDRCRGVEYCRQRAEEYSRSCKEKLEVLEESESRRSLAMLAEYVVRRAS
jgi:octaprenyl-diphosphate synthase